MKAVTILALLFAGGCISVHPPMQMAVESRMIDQRTADMAETLRYMDSRLKDISKRLDRIEGIESALNKVNKETK